MKRIKTYGCNIFSSTCYPLSSTLARSSRSPEVDREIDHDCGRRWRQENATQGARRGAGRSHPFKRTEARVIIIEGKLVLPNVYVYRKKLN
jgi:hypothetical protein